MNPYDEIAYPSAPLPRTHPHALGGLLLLHGYEPPPRQRALRILDIGCGAGRNLTWIAATAGPLESCLGVDLAASAIAEAREFAGLLPECRVRFEVRDFRSLTAGGGQQQYDCIIANGLYSWVAPEVRAELLRCIDRLLAADGVAYVSFHEDRDRPWRQGLLAIPDLRDRLRAARQAGIGDEAEDGLLVHDHLAEISDPVSVAEFRAALPAGLAYLCDARLDRQQGAAADEFHEAVLIRSGRERIAGDAASARIWWVTAESFPAAVQGIDPEETAIVEVLSHPRPAVAEAQDPPVAWPVARRLAEADIDPLWSYFGALIEMDSDADRQLLQSLDGTRPLGSLTGEERETVEFFGRAGLLIER